MGWQGGWLGLDDDGHVAIFCFNDAGVAPVVFLEWCASRNPFVPTDKRPKFEGAVPCSSPADLDRALPKPSPFRFFTEAGSLKFFPVFGAGKHAKAGKKEIVVWVDDAKTVADDIEARRAKLLAEADVGALITYREYSADTRKKLHGPKGACRSCLDPMWLEDYRVAARGVYVYENEYAEWNGPYVCRAAPKKPLELKTLPKPLRARLERTRLEGCSFAKQPRVQPAAHLPCDSTNGRESYYVDFDGVTVRPIPGREDNFHPASFSGEGPVGERLQPVEPASKKKNASARRPPAAERRATFSELAATKLKVRVARWSGTGPMHFVLIETLAEGRLRCFVGDKRQRDHSGTKRAIVEAAKLAAWLDRHATGWREWLEESTPYGLRMNEALFRQLVGNVLPGSADPHGPA